MVIYYTSYKSSSFASFISFLSSSCLVSGAFGALGIIFTEYRTLSLIITAILLPIGIGFWYLAKFIAQKAHIRRLTNDLEYTKDYISEDPSVQEFCMENNQKYNEYYYSKIGSANFDPNDYRP